MTPWPTADVASYNHSPPTYSPMQQQNYTDPFASYGAGPGMPQFNNNTQQQQQPPPPQQQPPAQQAPVANNNVDPWATMTMQAQPPAPTQPPMQAQPPMMQAQQPPSQPPMQQQMQQAIPQEQQTPPPAYVNATGNQTPPSPLGDVSVLAAANNAAVAAAQAISTAPSMPTAANTNMQPLQPVPQSMPMMMQAAPPQAQQQQQQQPTAAANPFDFNAVANTVPSVPVGAPPMAPPPAMAPPQAPPTPPDAVQQQQQTQQQPSFTTQSQYADPFGYAFSPMTSPVTSPGGSLNGTPNGSPGAIVPSSSPNADPFGVFGGQVPPAPPQNNTDPFGSSSGALVTSSTSTAPSSNGAVNDPFGIFGSGPAPAPTQAPPVVAQQQCQQQAFSAPTTPQEEEDPWAAAGFGQAVSTSSPSQSNSFPQPSSSPVNNMNNNDSSPVYNHSNLGINGNKQEDKPITLDQNNLPSEGEYYEARINSRSLGTMFYTARNVEDTLFSKMASNVTAALGSRPIVAYVAENSAAHNAGIHLGHVILSVNGHEITDPEQCANVIRSAPRPMNIRCYVPPDLELTISEGKHMVKYDTKDLHAPSTKMEWKEKYVVIGGIVTKPWMMNMFYKKGDYDIAVKEAHAGHKVSVKVKQFDLRGARIILNGKDGKPNIVDYSAERRPWYYITIMPAKGYPIKISADSLEKLEPVYASIRKFIKQDMEARYQYRMEENFGRGDSYGSSGQRSRGSPGAGFEGFGDANPVGSGSYWNN